MIRTLIWFVYFWGSLIWSIPSLKRSKSIKSSLSIEKKDELIHRFPKKWANSLVKLTGSNVNVIGEEHIPTEGPVLFVSNHQGNFDIPLLIGFIKKPKGFISKVEVKKMPIIAEWMELMKCVFMDRSNPRQSVKALQKGTQYLNEGHSIVVFPEGTRSKSDEIGEFKKGSFRLALKSGVPIIPITINGSYKIMEQNGFIIKPANVTISISKPIYQEEYKELSMDEVAEYTKGVISGKFLKKG
jgi:1-acyl-sn-glycerol-3-phosphate acyltransferase